MSPHLAHELHRTIESPQAIWFIRHESLKAYESPEVRGWAIRELGAVASQLESSVDRGSEMVGARVVELVP